MSIVNGEVGFINLHATIIASDLLDNKVAQCDHYEYEKK